MIPGLDGDDFHPGEYWIRFLQASIYGDSPRNLKKIRGLWEIPFEDVEGKGSLIAVDFDGQLTFNRFFPKGSHPSSPGMWTEDDFEEWDAVDPDRVLSMFPDELIRVISKHIPGSLDESADPNFDVHYAVEVWHTPDEEEEFFWRLVVVFKFAHHVDYDIAPKIGPEYASGAEDIRIKIKPLLLEHEVNLRKKHKYREDQLAFTKYKNLMVYQKRFKFLDELLDPEGLDPVDLAIHIAKMYRR